MGFPDRNKWHDADTFFFFLFGYIALWLRSIVAGALLIGHKDSVATSGSGLRAAGFAIDFLISMAGIGLLAYAQHEMLAFIYTVSHLNRWLILVGGSVAMAISHLMVMLLTHTKKRIHGAFIAITIVLYLLGNLAFWLPAAIERSDNQEWVAWSSIGGVSLVSMLTALTVIYGENYSTSIGKCHAIGLIFLIFAQGFGYASLFMVQFALNHSAAF